MDYVAPKFEAKGFNCPHCQAYAFQRWSAISHGLPMSNHRGPLLMHYNVSLCDKCEAPSFWRNGMLIYPLSSIAPPPSDDIAQDYNEARNVLAISPRSSAALLRLVVQKLCGHLGQHHRTIDEDIAALVGEGLPRLVQQALDSVRVIGNNAVHPGELDLRDDQATALALFKAVNLIVQHTITAQREMEELYNTLPEGARQRIDRRDHRA